MTGRAPAETILELSFANVAARALHVVAEAGVGDAIDDHPRTAGELAASIGLDADALERLLRVLEQHGIFRRDNDGRWHHTDPSRLLRSDHPGSLRDFAWMAGTPVCWESLTHLDHTLRTGAAGITCLHPDGTFAYFNEHPDERRIFQAAMTSKAHADIAAAIAAHDFSRYSTVCDVGGGQGHLVRAIVDGHPHTRGVLFDLPQVTAGIEPRDGVEVVGGSFFTDPLPRADAYVLMNVIHDWDDEAAIDILRAAQRAGQPLQSAVLVLEPVLPEGPERHWSKTLDVLMLASTGGRERTLTQYADLFTKAGLELIRYTPTANPSRSLKVARSEPVRGTEWLMAARSEATHTCRSRRAPLTEPVSVPSALDGVKGDSPTEAQASPAAGAKRRPRRRAAEHHVARRQFRFRS